MSVDGSETLPQGWEWATVEQLASDEPNAITDGPFGSNLKTEHYTLDGPRVIRLQNIGDGVFVDAKAHISQEHFNRLAKHWVAAGDVVIAALGETLPRSCIVPPWVGPALVKADCIRFKPNERLALPNFLNFALNSESTRDRVSSIVHGVGRPRLNLGEVKSIVLPVAPLAEQSRIVAAIETQFTRLDASVAALERARANLKRYRAAVLKAACEGRLVPTEAGLARAGEEPRREALSQAVGELQRPPEGWSFVRLEQLLKAPLANGRSVRDATTGFPVLRLTALRNGKVDLGQRKTGAWTEAEAAPFRVEKNDFLVSRGNGSLSLVGRGGLVEMEPDGVAYPDTLIRVRTDPQQIDSRYLRAVWNSLFLRRQIESSARTTAGIYKINQDHLRSFVLPLPPLAEQHRIVAEVERRLSVVEEMEGAIGANLKRAERLRQAILRRAFAGRLVAQDTMDEPASVLLERIRAERRAKASMQPKRTRGRKRQAVQPPLL